MREQSRSSGSGERWGTGAIGGLARSGIVKYVICTVRYTTQVVKTPSPSGGAPWHPGSLASLIPEKEGVGERQASGRRISTKPCAMYVHRTNRCPAFLPDAGAVGPFTKQHTAHGRSVPLSFSSWNFAGSGLQAGDTHPCGGARRTDDRQGQAPSGEFGKLTVWRRDSDIHSK